VGVLRVRDLPSIFRSLSIEEENGLLDSIFSGWKFVPAGELRHEVAAIPEARSFVKRHELLPRGTRARNARDGHPRPAPDRAHWRSIATGSALPERVSPPWAYSFLPY